MADDPFAPKPDDRPEPDDRASEWREIHPLAIRKEGAALIVTFRMAMLEEPFDGDVAAERDRNRHVDRERQGDW